MSLRRSLGQAPKTEWKRKKQDLCEHSAMATVYLIHVPSPALPQKKGDFSLYLLARKNSASRSVEQKGGGQPFVGQPPPPPPSCSCSCSLAPVFKSPSPLTHFPLLLAKIPQGAFQKKTFSNPAGISRQPFPWARMLDFNL